MTKKDQVEERLTTQTPNQSEEHGPSHREKDNLCVKGNATKKYVKSSVYYAQTLPYYKFVSFQQCLVMHPARGGRKLRVPATEA